MPSKISIGLGVLAAVSLAVNVAFFEMGSRFFRELTEVRLDPLGLALYAGQVPPAVAAKQKRVVMLGDSRIYMWNPPSDSPSFQFVNRGVSYQTTAQILGRFDREIPSLRPDWVLVEMGVNDLKAIPLFPSRRQEIVQMTKGNIGEIVRRSRDLGASVVLATIFPIGRVDLARRPFWSDDVARSIAEVNEFIYTLKGDKISVLDTDEVLLGAGHEIRREFSLDTLHLTPAAYLALDGALLPLLSR